MTQNYMFFPIIAKGKDTPKTPDEHLVRRRFSTEAKARAYAKKLLQEHTGRYNRVLITTVILIGSESSDTLPRA